MRNLGGSLVYRQRQVSFSVGGRQQWFWRSYDTLTISRGCEICTCTPLSCLCIGGCHLQMASARPLAEGLNSKQLERSRALLFRMMVPCPPVVEGSEEAPTIWGSWRSLCTRTGCWLCSSSLSQHLQILIRYTPM